MAAVKGHCYVCGLTLYEDSRWVQWRKRLYCEKPCYRTRDEPGATAKWVAVNEMHVTPKDAMGRHAALGDELRKALGSGPKMMRVYLTTGDERAERA